jgi:hypothetical protein
MTHVNVSGTTVSPTRQQLYIWGYQWYIQVPGETGIEGSQSACHLAITNFEQTFMQSELACSKSETDLRN